MQNPFRRWFQKNAPSAGSARIMSDMRARYNPLRNFNPDKLVAALDGWRIGTLEDLARILEELEQRNYMMMTCSRKMKASVSRCPYTVRLLEGHENDPTAQLHQQVLEKFWASIRVTDCFNRNVRGGVRMLVKNMMEAQSRVYSVSEIVWTPKPDGIMATFVKTPLHFFENHTGRLRYLNYLGAYDGIDMNDGEWLVTIGDGVGIAASVCAMAQSLSFQDWLLFSERAGIPIVHAKTPAQKGSPAWEDLVNGVVHIGRFGGLVTDTETDVQTVSLAAGGTPPYPLLIDTMNRAIATLYRGADLSTLSQGKGDGTGASVQADETDILEQDACEMISETLQEQVERYVIAYNFGEGTRPLAFIKFEPDAKPDLKQDMEVDDHLANLGVQLSKREALERYGRREFDPNDAEDSPLVLRTTATGGAGTGLGMFNEGGAAGSGAYKRTAEAVAAFNRDMKSVAAKVAEAIKTHDPAQIKLALEAVPKGYGQELASILARQMAEGIVAGAGKTR